MRTIIIISLFLWSLTLRAQTLPIKPLSDKLVSNSQDILIENLPSFNNDSLYKVKNPHREGDSSFHPQKFACGIPKLIDFKRLENSWQTEGDYKIFKLRIKSSTALGFKFRFSKFNLPPSGCLFIYPPDKLKIYGAYTKFNNRPSNDFITQEIPFRDLILEINIKTTDFNSLELMIDEIAYVFQSEDFQNYHSLQFGHAPDFCHINVICPVPNNDWCNEVRSVVKLEMPVKGDANYENIADYSRCSGALVNNKEGDLTPYILTAHHCVADPDPQHPETPYDYRPFLNNAVVTFNWHSPTCAPTSIGNDHMTMTSLLLLGMTGWTNCAFGPWKLRCPDMALLKIAPAGFRFDYNSYFAGWNFSTSMSDFSNPYVSCVHHPLGDVKKFASGVASDELSSGCDKSDCWKVGFYAGLTQPGSSGSPLFANDHKIIGVCNRVAGSVFEGQDPICHSIHPLNQNDTFNGGSLIGFAKVGATTARNMLKPFLCPNNPDEHDLSGLDPFLACIDFIEIYGQLYPGNDYQVKNQIRIQTSNEMLLGERPTLLDGSGIPGNLVNKCDYIFTAANRIQIRSFGGFSIKYGNKMSIRVEPCSQFIDCGFNHQNALVTPNDFGANKNLPSTKQISQTKKVNLFPSPSSNLLNLEANGIDGETRIIVKNILGVEIFSTTEIFNTSFTKIAINTSTYANGIFFLQLVNSKGELISINKFSILQ